MEEKKVFAMPYPYNKTCTHLSLGVCPCPKAKTDNPYHIKKTRWGYSTKLMLYDDPWKIKKVLQESDVEDSKNRLLLARELAEGLILPVLDPEANTEVGAQIKIWDMDTNSMHVLVVKKWVFSGNCSLTGNWIQDFVIRRGLKKGDEIGLHWDPYKKHFDFSVLFRTMGM